MALSVKKKESCFKRENIKYLESKCKFHQGKLLQHEKKL